MNDQGADYVYTGKNPIPFMLPNGLKEILDYPVWLTVDDKENKLPLFSVREYLQAHRKHDRINVVRFSISEITDILLERLKQDKTAVGIIWSQNDHAMAELRRIFFDLIANSIDIPVIIERKYPALEDDQFRIYSATDAGGLFIDGLGDGIMLSMNGGVVKDNYYKQADLCNKTAFGILQATRNRMSKTEYISCPSCGRTLFDLQSTTAMIRKRTDHLKGVKIGIMGCIVNGPGEMADADYGYVGSGPARITLYRGKEVVKRNVPSAQAVDELITLIKEDGNWIDPETIEHF
jgi:(E)-4-hydroxy-3-methylbut-2-enyl-diphosphate synthase